MEPFVAGIEGIREVRTYTFQLSALSTGMMVYSLKNCSEAAEDRGWQIMFLVFVFVCGFLSMHFFVTAFNASHILSNALLMATNESQATNVDFWRHFNRLNDSIIAADVSGGNAFMMKLCFLTFVMLSGATIARTVLR